MSSISFPLISFNDTLCIYLFFSFSVGPREVSLLSCLPNFSPHCCLLILHSRPLSCVFSFLSFLFFFSWLISRLSFISHNTILFFYCFVWLCGNFYLFPSAFRDFLSSSWCILHLCLFCPAAFYTYFFPICCSLFYYFHLFNLFAP